MSQIITHTSKPFAFNGSIHVVESEKKWYLVIFSEQHTKHIIPIGIKKAVEIANKNGIEIEKVNASEFEVVKKPF